MSAVSIDDQPYQQQAQPGPVSREPAMNLRGDTVGIGPLCPELLRVYERWLSHPDRLAALDRRFRPTTSDWIRAWYERQSRSADESQVYTIWDIDSMTAIGNAALQDIDARSRVAELGMFIAEPKYLAGSHGVETVRLMLRVAFDILSLENVMARVSSEDRCALETFADAGFTVIGRRRRAYRFEDTTGDVVLMDFTSADDAAS